MEFANRRRRALEGAAAFAATAALMYLGNGLEPVWPLVWVAPLPVLWFALRASARTGTLIAGAAWFAGYLNLWGYFHHMRLPAAVWLAIGGMAAIAFGIAVWLYRMLVRRGALWSALAAFPGVWVAFEYARNLAWPHGTSTCLAYSQLAFLPFLQMASVAGPWGMGFILLLFPAGLAIALHLGHDAPRESRRMLLVTVAIVALILIFGTARLALPQPGPEVRVGLIASDQDTARAGIETERLLQAYAERARELASEGAQAILLPEKLGTVTDPGTSAEDAILQRVADEKGVVVVAGFVRESAGAAFNEARVYRRGQAVASYDKEHMLPPFELRFTPGKALLAIETAAGVWGVAICKDMDFTPLAGRYGERGAGLMLVPAWDFDIDRAWHGHMAVMRSVEDGFSVARAARNGYLTVSDNRGRIVAETRSDAAPFATLIARVPAGHSGTVFQGFGIRR